MPNKEQDVGALELRYCKEHRTIHCSCEQRVIDRQARLIENLEAENKRLKENLEKYGRHRLSCNLQMPAAVRKLEKNGRKECTCDFDQVLKGGE
jgi:uncharacterized protein YcfL